MKNIFEDNQTAQLYCAYGHVSCSTDNEYNENENFTERQ